MTTFYCLRFETPQTGGPGPRIYIPQEQAGPIMSLGTGSLLVASYDSQGYSGGIRPRLQMGRKQQSKYYWSITMETVFSVGSNPRLYNEDPRPTEDNTGGSLLRWRLNDWEEMATES
jgi:hypothetical protein